MREILISESAWEEMTCLFAPSLDKVALQKNKSCLLISNDWLKEQEELMAQELKEGNSPLTKDDYETFNTAGRDYIKYKCLAQSDFLNNSGKNKDE
ncbi:hypothetical protein [Escherichia coli]|uniref:hypothetical protein n=1 Tax=Escherichia coli TaxID=562 RepID=UPI00386B05D0